MNWGSDFDSRTDADESFWEEIQGPGGVYYVNTSTGQRRLELPGATEELEAFQADTTATFQALQLVAQSFVAKAVEKAKVMSRSIDARPQVLKLEMVRGQPRGSSSVAVSWSSNSRKIYADHTPRVQIKVQKIMNSWREIQTLRSAC
jgi:hypothetical protein